MHELSVATELLRACSREVESRGGGQLRVAEIAVGELSAIEPDLLKYAWEALTEDSCCAGARLLIDWRRARQTCATCGEIAERQPGSWMRMCPQCQAPLTLEGGRELDILSISFDPIETPQENRR